MNTKEREAFAAMQDILLLLYGAGELRNDRLILDHVEAIRRALLLAEDVRIDGGVA